MNEVDGALAAGMGAVKSVKARLSGLVGVFRTLAEQHGEAASLMGRAKADDDRFAELWPTIRRELLSHEKAEVREVFPVIRSHADTRAQADHHDEEATELERMIHQLDALPPASDARRELFATLIETVLHHANEEEAEIFPAAQEVLGTDRAEQLDAPFLLAKSQVAASV